MRVALTTLLVAGCLVAGGSAADAKVKVADITFAGSGFASASGIFQGLDGATYTGGVTIDVDADDTDPTAGLGVYPSANNELNFAFPLLGLTFDTTIDEPVTTMQVTGKARTLTLDSVADDGDLQLSMSFVLTDAGSVFTPDERLPRHLPGFWAFDTLAFAVALADLSNPTALLGSFTVAPGNVAIDVHTPLPASVALFGAGLVALGVLRRRRNAQA
ncbi:MAG: hypothetical protein AAFX81_06105 [Pseudomonadota bacterium]